MHMKRIIGIVMTLLGIFLIISAVQSMQEIANAKGFVEGTKNFFTHNPSWNPIVEFFGGKAQQEVAKYDILVLVMLIAGVALAIAGVVMTIRHKRKHL